MRRERETGRESVYSARFTNEEITERRRKLMVLRHEAEVEHFPTGDLPEREDLLTLRKRMPSPI